MVDINNRLGPSQEVGQDDIICKIENSLDLLPSMKNLVPLQQCRFQVTENVHDESSLIFNNHKQEPWPMVSILDRSACVLPRFKSLMQGIGFDPTLSNPFGPHGDGVVHSTITPLSAHPHFSIHRGTFPEPSMYGSSGVQGSLLALVSSNLLSVGNTLAVFEPVRVAKGAQIFFTGT